MFKHATRHTPRPQAHNELRCPHGHIEGGAEPCAKCAAAYRKRKARKAKAEQAPTAQR